MCGIFGFVGEAPLEDASSVLQRGNALQRHRGPDAEGLWHSQDARVGLSHVRLAIIDLSNDAAQPMQHAEAGLVLTYNGELYNYQELRAELGGAFWSQSDTEVVLKAWLQWGPQCLSRFRGMFAFALWDARARTLFMARDRFGMKPLYYTVQGTRLFFASEQKALVSHLSRRRLHPQALAEYLWFQLPLGTHDLLDEIHELAPAHYAVVTPGSPPRCHRYWNVSYPHPDEIFVSQDPVGELAQLLTTSLDEHLRADVAVGAYVSGGIDSSLLAAMVAKNQKASGLDVFHGRFAEGALFDELPYAQELASSSTLNLHVCTISPDDFINTLERLVYHLDGPVAGPGSFPQFMVSALAAQTHKVVLGGQGADEVFGGYTRYLVGALDSALAHAIDRSSVTTPGTLSLADLLGSLGTLKNYKPLLKEFWSGGLFDPSDARYLRLIGRQEGLRALVTFTPDDQTHATEAFQSIFLAENVRMAPFFDQMLHFDLKTLLPGLLRVEDRVSMAHGLESRLPYLDHRILEWFVRLPLAQRFPNGCLKHLLREVSARYLPQSILAREDKMGFPVPLTVWAKTSDKVRQFIGDTLGSQRALQRQYLNKNLRRDLLLNEENLFGRSTWALLSLELYQQRFIDSA